MITARKHQNNTTDLLVMSRNLLPLRMETFYYNPTALKRLLQEFIDNNHIRHGLIRRLTLRQPDFKAEGIYCYLEYRQYADNTGNLEPCRVELVYDVFASFQSAYNQLSIDIDARGDSVQSGLSDIALTGGGTHVWIGITAKK